MTSDDFLDQYVDIVLRPDNPRFKAGTAKDTKPKIIKYEFPQGYPMRIDCPPICQAMMADPSIPLWVTEGIKKADALASRGLCAIDLLGVWNFKGKNQFGRPYCQLEGPG